MNQYQQEVAAMDQRHRLAMRGLSFAGAAVLVAAALWSAGLPPHAWWAALHGLGDGRKKAESVVAKTPAPISAAAPPVTTAPTAEVLPGTDSSISPTPQLLYLVSTAPGRTKYEGTAQIGTNPDNPQTYVGGAILANGSRLVEIHANRVVIARDGRSMSLHVGHNSSGRGMLNDFLAVGGQSKAKLAPVTSNEVLTDYVRPSPVYEGERILGYQVYAGQRSSVFSQLGLQNGDVVTSLDDIPLTDPKQAIGMFRQLAAGASMIANIERNGKPERISLDGSLIVADQE